MDTAIHKKLGDFFSSYPIQVFTKGNILLQAGQEPSGVWYIESGVVRSYWISEEGTEITLNMYKLHTFLPMSWAVADVANNNFYEAMTQVSTRKAPKDVFLRFLKKEPDIVYDLLKRIYIGMEGLWMHIESMTTGNARIKLITSLVILTKRFGKEEENGTVIQLKMNEKDIANYVGMSRETANRELQKLKKEKLVTFTKGILTITDINTLESKIQQ